MTSLRDWLFYSIISLLSGICPERASYPNAGQSPVDKRRKEI